MAATTINSYAAKEAKAKLEPFQVPLPELEADQVLVKVLESSICHSDVHIVDNDWGFIQYPVVPGHEVVGVVVKRGSQVKSLEEGQRVGVGWINASCKACEYCLQGEENHCSNQGATALAQSGGFADHLVCQEHVAVPVPDALKSVDAAPMLCAGITVFAPLAKFLKPGSHVGIIGIGGLGHLGLQFARSLGYHVTAISRGPEKKDSALSFGAHAYLDSKDAAAMKQARKSLDLVLNTTSAELNLKDYLNLLRRKGTFVFLGAAGTINLPANYLLMNNINVTASNVGSANEIRQMFEIAARDNIKAVTKSFDATNVEEVNKAMEGTREGSARFRNVLHFANL